TTPVAWRTARIEPVRASSTLTGTGAWLSVSSAVCLLQVVVASATERTTNFQTPTPKQRRMSWKLRVGDWRLSAAFMAAALLWRARDPLAQFETGRSHPVTSAGRREWPAVPAIRDRCPSARAGRRPGRAARPAVPAE